MADQMDLFAASPPPEARETPEGFRYQRNVLTRETERALLGAIRELPFRDFEFHGYVGKRRTVSFGAEYDFGAEKLRPAADIPAFLLDARAAAAAFAELPAAALQQVLVTEYGAQAGIGWHRDKGVLGDVIGLSLLSPCRFRLRRKRGDTWQRFAIEAEPRSAYLLSGPARTEWEHSIPPVDAPRYSITFRTVRPRPS